MYWTNLEPVSIVFVNTELFTILRTSLNNEEREFHFMCWGPLGRAQSLGVMLGDIQPHSTGVMLLEKH